MIPQKVLRIVGNAEFSQLSGCIIYMFDRIDLYNMTHLRPFAIGDKPIFKTASVIYLDRSCHEDFVYYHISACENGGTTPKCCTPLVKKRERLIWGHWKAYALGLPAWAGGKKEVKDRSLLQHHERAPQQITKQWIQKANWQHTCFSNIIRCGLYGLIPSLGTWPPTPYYYTIIKWYLHVHRTPLRQRTPLRHRPFFSSRFPQSLSPSRNRLPQFIEVRGLLLGPLGKSSKLVIEVSHFGRDHQPRIGSAADSYRDWRFGTSNPGDHSLELFKFFEFEFWAKLKLKWPLTICKLMNIKHGQIQY